MERQQIIDEALNSGLIRRCCECQVAKSKGDRQWLDDLTQDLYVWMAEYDEEKLKDAYNNNHINALLTRVLINWLWSNTSPYHRTYRKFERDTDEITKELEETTPDE